MARRDGVPRAGAADGRPRSRRWDAVATNRLLVVEGDPGPRRLSPRCSRAWDGR
jgi:hypothetical protein